MSDLMNYGVYVVYDDATEQYGIPFVAESIDAAIRECVCTFMSVDDVVLSDMRIFEIGEYEPVKGIITGYSIDSRYFVCDSDTLIKRVNQARSYLERVRNDAISELDELKKLKTEKDIIKENN